MPILNRKMRRAATPRGRDPSLVFTYLAIGAPPEIVRLPRARARRPVIRRVTRGLRSPVDFAVPTALLRGLTKCAGLSGT